MSRVICWILYALVAILIVLMGMESKANAGYVHIPVAHSTQQEAVDAAEDEQGYLDKYNMALDRTFVVVVVASPDLVFGKTFHSKTVVEGVCEEWNDPLFGERTCSKRLSFEEYIKKYMGSRYYIVGGYYDKHHEEITLYVNRTKLGGGK